MFILQSQLFIQVGFGQEILELLPHITTFSLEREIFTFEILAPLVNVTMEICDVIKAGVHDYMRTMKANPTWLPRSSQLLISSQNMSMANLASQNSIIKTT